MKTVSIEHKSRNNLFAFTWEPDNVTPWPFIAQDDGEIFYHEKTNIDNNWLINGAVPTFPFPVIKGLSYSVTPSKINPSNSASVTLYGRRATNKTFNIAVPSFVAYDGRYLYLLLNNNSIEKHDTLLFASTNYTGSGVWTLNTLVSTIALPTPPDGSTWGAICFVKNNNTPKLLCIARLNTTATTNCYACYVRIFDDAVYSLDFTVANGYTNITTYIIHTAIVNILYDYISEHVYLVFAGATAYPRRLDLNTLQQVIVPNLDYNTTRAYRSRNYFIPTANKLASIGVLSLPSTASNAAILGGSITVNSGWAYSLLMDRIITGNSMAAYTLSSFSLDASVTSSYSIASDSNHVSKQVLTRLINNNNNVCFAPVASYPGFAWYQFGSGKNGSYNLSAGDLATGQTGFYDAFFTKYNNLFFTVGNGGTGGRKRLFIFDIDTINQVVSCRYLDRSSDINNIHTNQLLL